MNPSNSNSPRPTGLRLNSRNMLILLAAVVVLVFLLLVLLPGLKNRGGTSASSAGPVLAGPDKSTALLVEETADDSLTLLWDGCGENGELLSLDTALTLTVGGKDVTVGRIRSGLEAEQFPDNTVPTLLESRILAHEDGVWAFTLRFAAKDEERVYDMGFAPESFLYNVSTGKLSYLGASCVYLEKQGLFYGPDADLIFDAYSYTDAFVYNLQGELLWSARSHAPILRDGYLAHTVLDGNSLQVCLLDLNDLSRDITISTLNGIGSYYFILTEEGLEIFSADMSLLTVVTYDSMEQP